MSINAIKVNEIFEGKIKLYKIAPLSLIMEKANYIKSNRIQKFGKSDKINLSGKNLSLQKKINHKLSTKSIRNLKSIVNPLNIIISIYMYLYNYYKYYIYLFKSIYTYIKFTVFLYTSV